MIDEFVCICQGTEIVTIDGREPTVGLILKLITTNVSQREREGEINR